MTRKPAKTCKDFGELRNFIAQFCKRAAKQAISLQQARQFFSISRKQKGQATATVQLQCELPKKAHQQKFVSTAASASCACWQATAKAVTWLEHAGLLKAKEIRRFAELAASRQRSSTIKGPSSSTRTCKARHAKALDQQKALPPPPGPSSGKRTRQAQPAKAVKQRQPPPQSPLPQLQAGPAAKSGAPSGDASQSKIAQGQGDAEEGQYRGLADQLTRLQLLLGHRFNNLQLLTTALLLFDRSSRGTRFRRLAFLGDAVLGMAAAMEGSRVCPADSPKEADARRVQRVSRVACEQYASLLDLRSILPQGAGRHTLAEAFEALLGAMLLDAGEAQGIKKIVEFYERLMQFFPLEGDAS